eukprot:scaffold803_cov310-Pinguiococcus_pyrenoidosus.AAC.11
MSSRTEWTSPLICASGWLNMVVWRTREMSWLILRLVKPILAPMSAAAAWNSRKLATAAAAGRSRRASKLGMMVKLCSRTTSRNS